MEAWPALLGWPSIVIALGLSVIGIKRRQAVWLFISAGLLLPICIYLAWSPQFWWLGLSVLFSITAAGVAVRMGQDKVAIALYLLVIAVVTYLAALVFWQ